VCAEFRELRIQVLGPVSAWLGDQALGLGPARQRALLALLAFRPGRPVSRDEIIDAVWGHSPPASAANGVHTYVKGLRRVLEPDRPRRSADGILTSVTGGYLLRLKPELLDAVAAEQLISQASRLKVAGDLPLAVRSLDSALALWQAVPLLGIPGPWAQTERIRLTELRLTAIEERGDVLLAAGQHAEAAVELASLVREHPLRERLRAQLMTALYRCGRQADALAVFTQTREILVDELGVEPGPGLQQLQQRILRADPDLAQPDPVPGTARRTVLRRPPAHDSDRRRPARKHGQRPATGQPVPRQLPTPGRGFAGRSAELATLTELLDQAALPARGDDPQEPSAAGGRTVVISAIGGMAGIGKTTLALYWAHQVADLFPDGQLYVNLRGFDPDGVPITATQALRGFLDALGVPAARIPAGLDAQATLYRSLMAGRRILVVLDNARDDQQVRPLLPGSRSAMVVVTSRSLLIGLVAAEGAHPLTLDLLATDEAHELVAGRLDAGRLSAEPEAVPELVRLCGRLPLALSVATARLATQPALPIGAVVADLTDVRRRLDALAVDDPMTSIRAVFSWSHWSLTPAAARMFRLLGVHPGPDISIPAAASLAGVSHQEARILLAELEHLHLVMEPVPGRFAFHDLMRAYAAELSAAGDDSLSREAAMLRALDHYAHTAGSACLAMNPARDAITLSAPRAGAVQEPIADDAEALAWFTSEHQVLLRALSVACDRGWDGLAWQIAWSIADFLGRQGHWHDWTATQRIALASAERLGDRPGQAYAHRSLGEICLQFGSLTDAEPHLRQAIELFSQIEDRAGRAGTELALAHLLEQRGLIPDALSYAQRALVTFSELGHRPGQARALNNVGWCQALTGDYQQTLGYCRQALDLHAELGNRFGQAATLDSLGFAHHNLGDHAEAIGCYGRAVELYVKLGERYLAADVLAHLGDSCLAAGDLASAGQAWQSALSTLDDLGHPNAASVRVRLDELHLTGEVT
jgi:DNA-binding SARP family transcriptional activator